ncbi:MAG: Co2+/Mg2+ efflux protein ApaG [Haliea sp.]|jgi:ApaG protein|nr:Co2+/Mg2+ efflux protein ApaG [Haliea sp.]
MDNTEQKRPFDPNLVNIGVVTSYLLRHSRPADQQYTFAYTITIHNTGSEPVQLMSRHWIITDADGAQQEVRGEGVVGEQPVIQPGTYFRYTSGTTLATPVGFMEGSYAMVVRASEGQGAANPPGFNVPIRAFTLHTPTALN